MKNKGIRPSPNLFFFVFYSFVRFVVMLELNAEIKTDAVDTTNGKGKSQAERTQQAARQCL